MCGGEADGHGGRVVEEFAGHDRDLVAVEAQQARRVGPQSSATSCDDGVEDLLLRRLGRDERGDAPQRGLLVDERPQPRLVAAALELGGARAAKMRSAASFSSSGYSGVCDSTPRWPRCSPSKPRSGTAR